MSGDLHPDELPADAATVRALLAEQAPHLAALPVRPLTEVGTVNRVFRLGDALAVRIPRRAVDGADVEREAAVVPIVATVLRAAVPEVVLAGRPSAALPAAWSVVRWIDGERPRPGAVPGADLAEVVRALRSLDPAALPGAGRATAAAAAAAVRDAIARLTGFDTARVTAAWDATLEAPVWDGVRVPIHADLLPPNLLVRRGRLAGVLDWGTAGAGDPANDLVPAWSCLRGADRRRFRAALGGPDGDWARAKGIALAQALVAIPYYDTTNPGFAALCRATLDEVLADR
ncbi:phosphotransferase [Amnibacterium kyonggiense]|uniref:Aminoglycoside phosphotransferase (APT) family kinase protein n=1 Tax=Amnibacterium kyonggiense TaxID=595671 RepID=A0A4R7FFN6_9MICO|nr:phosphotransferase [Amnibacterium kyonggiense]TDS75670.1 aminoglycoside phosphotransferase (APT) family kinase protein [Amnibacterium kyonggiense]